MVNFPKELIKEFLNTNWLRPENAVWDTKAALLLREYFPRTPSLDFGCGNGLTMFIAAGGMMDINYDWYINTNTEGFQENADIYDAYTGNDIGEHILKTPPHYIDSGFDHKQNLLNQAQRLHGFYKRTVIGNAQETLPFENEEFLDVYSNILYWLKEPFRAVNEIHRILQTGGRLIVCAPRKEFFKNCPTYNYSNAGKYSGILKLLNRGRGECHHWTAMEDTLYSECKKRGFKLISKKRYLSPETLLVWDIGLRPLSPPLISMANALTKEKRARIKQEWMDIAMVYLKELWALEEEADDKDKGFSLLVFEKK